MCVVIWSSLVCLWGCLCTLCECGGCGDCDVVCTVVCVACTRGSGIVSSASDVLGMRGVGGVCEMCICLAWSGVVVRLSVWFISVYYSCLEIAEFPDCVHWSVPLVRRCHWRWMSLAIGVYNVGTLVGRGSCVPSWLLPFQKC